MRSGHDEESRNGRDINIDILEAYIWTSEVFHRHFTGVPGGYRNPPGAIWALMGFREKGAGHLSFSSYSFSLPPLLVDSY